MTTTTSIATLRSLADGANRFSLGDHSVRIEPQGAPEVRQAVLNASFEALVGFQLTQDQLRYNATR